MRSFLLKDYMIYNSNKLLKLRKRIQKTHFILFRVMLKRRYNKLLFKCQSFIPITKSISNDLLFPHGICGVFISQGAKIARGCVIFQQVTIGSNALGDSKNKGFPELGENCYIGAGAKIIGNVKIGDNVRIGANTVVTSDVPDNATVVSGAKLRIIEHNYKLDNSFVPFVELKKK